MVVAQELNMKRDRSFMAIALKLKPRQE
jgi:hypothetical protein